jgi:hypothetical protein
MMEPFTWFIEKDPYDEVDKTFEFGPNPVNRGWLRLGESVVSGSIVAGSGITATGATTTATNITTRLSGGQAGVTYDVAVRITTSTGQKVEKTARVYVRDV